MGARSQTRVAVCGALGRMGREIVAGLAPLTDLRLVAAVDPNAPGDAASAALCKQTGVPIDSDLATALDRGPVDVLVDFTAAAAAGDNARMALAAGAAPVIGTTGLSRDALDAIHNQAQALGRGAFFAPNFAIGAVLLMKFAAAAARYFPDAEIIEMHHEQKRDSPSGTSLAIAEHFARARHEAGATASPVPDDCVETAPGARGAVAPPKNGVRIHSVRLPGVMALHEAILGSPGQVLTLRHDTTDRTCYVPGVLLAVRRVREWTGLRIGLDSLLDLS